MTQINNLNIKTKVLHAGYNPAESQRTRTVPIYQTVSYVFNNAAHAANLFGLREFGYIYTRLNNPTNDILEQRLAAAEGGIGAVAFSSGAAAIASTLLTILKSNDHIVSSSSLYGGTYNLLNVTLPRYGINTSFVDADDISNFEKSITENTKVIFIESLGNPKLDILDIEGIAKIAKTYNIPLIVDNTVTTPILLNPIEYGASIVIHSLTKYIGGGSSLGGIVVDSGNFDWTSGKFPEFTEPTKGYHGLIYSDTFEALAFLVKLRVEGLRDLGSALSPYNAFQFIQGLETLDVRIRQHSENALAFAKWLKQLDEVAWVNYPGLSDSKYYSLGEKYLPKGKSGIITFGLNAGYEAAIKLIDNVKIFSLLANIGDTKSLIVHPASTTHEQLSKEEQLTTGVTPELVRLSIGLEDVEDLKKDILQAL